MDIFPAIDLIKGKVVRLTEGDYGKVKSYDLTPLQAARLFSEEGASFLHLVDLDGAKDGALSNYDTIRRIVESTDLFVEVGGGIRNEERIEKYISLGVGRVILGTAAVKDRDFLKRAVEKYGEKIAVGVDAKAGKAAVDGWLTTTELDSMEFCRYLSSIGVKNVIYTDISKDGKLEGTNLDAYRELSKIQALNITASGGISRLEEIEELRDMGIHSAIIGKALYAGKLSLRDILACSKDKGEKGIC